MFGRKRRTAVAATVLAGAGLVLTACQGTGGGTAAAAPAATVTVTAAPIATSAPATPASTPKATPTSTPTPKATPKPSATVARCAVEVLKVSDAHPVEPTNADDTYDLDVKFTNLGAHSCSLKGFPTVGMAGNGDPSHSKPLKVIPQGTAHTVLLAPGGQAFLRLNLRQVLGEGDGYCASGATPAAPPTLVVGVGTGAAQIALEGGGYFAECDDVVKATAFLAAQP